MERSQQVVASVASYGSLSLGQAAMAYAVTPSAQTPSADDRSEASQPAAAAQTAQQAARVLADSNVNLTPASMAALIQAQASITQGAPAMIRQHTAERIGEMIWRLDDAPALSPAPFAIRQLQAARKALSESLIDLRA